jgi:hypothetical protein
VGALAHYLETAGVPTTQISLIREHTEIIRPPRALWVPFALGRPLGIPGDAAFQRRALLAALELLDCREGPVLVDFPDAVPEAAADARQSLEQLACPVSFAPSAEGSTDTDKLLAAFRDEVAEYRSWYDLELEKRGYSAIAYFRPEAAGQLLSAFILDDPLTFPEKVSAPATALRFAAQDLQAFYFEAVISRPDLSLPTDAEFNRWFWQKTAAGNVLGLARETCLASGDEQLRMTGGMLLVPMDQP